MPSRPWRRHCPLDRSGLRRARSAAPSRPRPTGFGITFHRSRESVFKRTLPEITSFRFRVHALFRRIG